MRVRRTSSVVSAAAAAVAVALAPGIAAAMTPAPSPDVVTVTASAVARPFVVRVGLSGTTVSMPSRLRAGTYVVHVSTTDQMNELQVVRPPSTLSRTRFVALWHAWWNSGAGTTSSWRAWRTSATFVGGAQVVPRSARYLNRTPGGVGTFAITLRPGR